MKTYLGRVVYDRKLHSFTPADLARIYKAITFEETPEVVAEIIAGLLTAYVLNVGATVETITKMVKIIINGVLTYIGVPSAQVAFSEALVDHLEDPSDIPGTSA